MELEEKLRLLEMENERLRRFNKSPKEKYYTIDMQSGEHYTASDLEREAKAQIQLSRQLKRLERENTVLIEEKKTTVNIKHNKNERRFIKLFYVTLRHLTEELEPTTLGVLQKLIQHLRTDGTNGLIGETAKKYWHDKLNMSKNSFDKHFKILQEYDLVNFIRNRGIFLNPYYVRYGNEVEQSTLDMFGLTYEVERGLFYKDKQINRCNDFFNKKQL